MAIDSRVDRIFDFAIDILRGPGADHRLPADQTFLHELTNGPCDCDKLDYLVRDSYHAGTREYGLVDVDRILAGLVVVEAGSLRHHIASIEAVLGMFKSYFYMYAAVYSHRTARQFDLMLGDAISGCQEYIKKMISRPGGMADLSDGAFLDRLRSHCASANKRKALDKISAFAERRKLLALIAEERLDLNIIWLETWSHEKEGAEANQQELDVPSARARQALQDVRTRMEGIGREAGVTVILDTRPRNRFLGMKPGRVRSWLDAPVVFDPRQGLRSLRDLNLSDFTSLGHISFPIRVFTERAGWEMLSEASRNDVQQKIRDALQTAITEIRSDFQGNYLARRLNGHS